MNPYRTWKKILVFHLHSMHLSSLDIALRGWFHPSSNCHISSNRRSKMHRYWHLLFRNAMSQVAHHRFSVPHLIPIEMDEDESMRPLYLSRDRTSVFANGHSRQVLERRWESSEDRLEQCHLQFDSFASNHPYSLKRMNQKTGLLSEMEDSKINHMHNRQRPNQLRRVNLPFVGSVSH